MITLWNYKLTAQDLVLTLYYSGGQYRIPFHLDARQAYNLDMPRVCAVAISGSLTHQRTKKETK